MEQIAARKRPLLYRNKLVEISDDSILIRGYYFPFGSRRVILSYVESITVLKLTFFSGKYRY